MKKICIILVLLIIIVLEGCQKYKSNNAFFQADDSTKTLSSSNQITLTPVLETPKTMPTVMITDTVIPSVISTYNETSKPEETSFNTPVKTAVPNLTPKTSGKTKPAPSSTIGEKLVTVPNVVGTTEVKALNIMKQAGITARVIYEFHERHNKGYVYNQEFPAGQKINPKASMFIWVSKGLVNPIVPNVIGMNYADAKRKLLNACDTWIISIAREFNNKPKDTVYSLNVTVGGGLSRDANVWIYVSDGPETFITVPNVIGHDYQSAKNQFEALGLHVRVEFTDSNSIDKDKIINQSPRGGLKISERDKGTVSVVLIVSTGPKPTPEPEV